MTAINGDWGFRSKSGVKGLVPVVSQPPPDDGFDAGYFQYQARTAFRDLCRVFGFEEARAITAEIINDEAGKART